MCPTEKIVLVENDSSWRKGFVQLLNEEYRESREFLPIEDVDSFVAKFKTARDFDEVACFLVDLELGPHASDIQINDTWGLDKVLPQIRRLAPWVPVACISSFAGAVETAAELSVTDFDGVYAKLLIYSKQRTGPYFNEKRWNDMIHSWQLKRAAWLMGMSITHVQHLVAESGAIKILPSDVVAQILSATGEDNFKAALKILGLPGEEISLTELVGSFSGIATARAVATGSDRGGEHQSTWLIKWGRPIRKLAEEAEGHKRWLKRGMHRDLQVPQFQQNVLPWAGLGYLAYYFEGDAETALSVEKCERNKIIKPLTKLLKSLYGGAKTGQYQVKDIFSTWFGFVDDELAQLTSKLNNGKALTVSKALIHGDLHLRNILICRDEPLLIDFAMSDYGPVALDAAKLLTDAAVFLDKPESLGSPISVDAIKKSPLAPLYIAFEPYLGKQDDLKLLEIAIHAYALKYMNYPDASEVKEELGKILGK